MFTSYASVLRQYAVFSGRARRREFWNFMFAHAVITLTLAMIVAIGEISTGTEPKGGELCPLGALYDLYFVVTLLPLLAVTVRRLHDTGHGGRWYFLCLLPVIGSLIVCYHLFLDSEPGSNKYGPSPKLS